MKMMFYNCYTFELKYKFSIIFCILYFKTKNNIMCTVYMIENDLTNYYIFVGTVL